MSSMGLEKKGSTSGGRTLVRVTVWPSANGGVRLWNGEFLIPFIWI